MSALAKAGRHFSHGDSAGAGVTVREGGDFGQPEPNLQSEAFDPLINRVYSIESEACRIPVPPEYFTRSLTARWKSSTRPTRPGADEA